jgi:hypothetical protein
LRLPARVFQLIPVNFGFNEIFPNKNPKKPNMAKGGNPVILSAGLRESWIRFLAEAANLPAIRNGAPADSLSPMKAVSSRASPERCAYGGDLTAYYFLNNGLLFFK